MHTFLTNTSQKKIKLFNFLLEANQWQTMETITKYLKVSNKMVLIYIEELTELFSDFKERIVLKNDRNQRFCIEKQEDFPVYNIYLHYFKMSYNYQLIDFMYKNPGKSLKDFADEQFSSVSTVFRYGKLLEPYFNRYALKFHVFKLELEGSETALRSFYYYFYWNSTRNGNWPFGIQEEEIDSYVITFENQFQLSLTALQRRSFAYWLAIILERSSLFHVKPTEEVQQIAQADAALQEITKWVGHCQLALSKEEQIFLYRVIHAFGVIDGHPQLEAANAAAHQLHQSVSYRAVLTLSKAIKQTFAYQIDLSDMELLFNFIAFHDRSDFLWGNPDVFFHRSHLETIKEQNTKVSEIFTTFLNNLSQLAAPDVRRLCQNQEQLQVNYYYVLDYYQLFVKWLQPIRILIQDDQNHTHRLWLMKKIEAFLGGAYPLQFFDYQATLEEVDLVISNYYLDTQDKPLILMKTIPTKRNWQELEQVLFTIISTQR